MAKKHRKSHPAKKHTTHRRRKRMGAISSDSKALLSMTLGGIIGAVGGEMLGKVIEDAASKASSSLSEYGGYINGGSQVAIGMLLPKLIKQSSPMLKGVQLGLTINGGVRIIKTTGVLSSLGIGSIYNVPMVAGADNRGFLSDARSQPVPMVGALRTRAMGIAAHA